MDKNGIKYNWDRMALAYESFTGSPNSYSSMIEWPAIKKQLPDLKNKSIVDLGCGTGRFSFLLEQFFPEEITGIDISKEMIKIAEQLAREKGSRAKFIQGDIEDLSGMASNSVDFVFSSTVLHYIKDLHGIMQEIYRILKSSSCCILSVIHPVYSAQYPIAHDDGMFPEDGDWEVKYLNKDIRAYVQPWIEYNPDIESFLSYSYHHTMADYINCIVDSGLSIKCLCEPLPPEEWKVNSPGRYYGYIDTPTYAIFKMEK
jgi:ubiquinone/menaquinone biosynthesis C-methylase UbiE